MGVAQLPWFLTKLLTSLYSGWFFAYCPQQGTLRTESMWFYYWLIACVSPVGPDLGAQRLGRQCAVCPRHRQRQSDARSQKRPSHKARPRGFPTPSFAGEDRW